MSGTPSPPSPPPNPNVPDVSVPLADVTALTACVTQLRNGIRSLAGLTGPTANRAVTFNDLATIGLTTVVSRVTALEARMTALEGRVTTIEAALPPPP